MPWPPSQQLGSNTSFLGKASQPTAALQVRAHALPVVRFSYVSRASSALAALVETGSETGDYKGCIGPLSIARQHRTHVIFPA